MTTPSLERMIEDLEEKHWVIADIYPSVSLEDRELTGYLMKFSYTKDVSPSDRDDVVLGKTGFETYQSTFKECVAQAWKLIEIHGV